MNTSRTNLKASSWERFGRAKKGKSPPEKLKSMRYPTFPCFLDNTKTQQANVLFITKIMI